VVAGGVCRLRCRSLALSNAKQRRRARNTWAVNDRGGDGEQKWRRKMSE
jgi:UDP-N-acetylmuramyl tripeptide synthase